MRHGRLVVLHVEARRGQPVAGGLAELHRDDGVERPVRDQHRQALAARRVEAYAGEPDPYKKPRVIDDEAGDEADDFEGDDLDGEDDRA